MTLIDLGEVDFQKPADPQPPVPRWLQALGLPSHRKASAVAALVILAGALAGTAPGAGPIPRLRTIPAVDRAAGMYWGADGIVVQYVAATGVVSATDLDSGRVLWSTTWADQSVQMYLGPDGAVLLQTSPAGPVPESGEVASAPGTGQEAYFHQLAGSGTVTVLDLRTGVRRFSRPGAAISPWGAPDLVIVERDPRDPAGWRMTELDIRDGHEVWTRPAPDGTRWIFTRDDDYASVSGGLLVMDSRDGLVVSIGARGQATPRGRVKPGGNLEWAWSNYVGISYQTGAVGSADEPSMVRFELHDLRTVTGRPLWTIKFDNRFGSMPWPCGRKYSLCHSENGSVYEIGIRDGAKLGAIEEEHPPFGPIDSVVLGADGIMWKTVGGWDRDDQAIAAVAPSGSKTGVGWLGLARTRDGATAVTPLMQVPLQITDCQPADETWIICDGVQQNGNAWDRSLVLRRSDLDELARQLGVL